MNLKPILNKTSSWVHTESEFDVLGVPRKLVKYVVHLSRRKFDLNYFFFRQAAQIAVNQFLVSRNFRG
jgi:hypothetical protein